MPVRWLALGVVLLGLFLPRAAGQGLGSTPSEVRIDLDRFGVGNLARPGDWAGIRVRVQDAALKSRDVIVRLTTRDIDGDSPWYERAITTNPGVQQGVWLYARLPFADLARMSMTVSVHEAIPAPDDPGAPTGFRAGRLLGRSTLTPRGTSVLAPTEGLIGILGPQPYGLQPYTQPAPNTNLPILTLGHEVSTLAGGLTPADMPDQWQGLAAFPVLIWGQGEVSELRGDRARAVRDWVNRGGHLVVILPPVGQTWTNPTSNDLYDIMPAVSVTRREGVDLTPLRPILTSDAGAVMPGSAVVHHFVPVTGATPAEATRILSSPDGDCVVVRRLVGAGAVTLVGLDLNLGRLSQFQLIDADVFWHRVLGRRAATNVSFDALRSAPGGLGLANTRTYWSYDQDIPELIAQKGKAAAGVALGFVVFVLYWLIAGPVGFGLLKMKKLTHHAWVSFVAAAAAFTAAAWGGATLLRPSRVAATHVTIVDHIYGQPVQRARGWFSILIPHYGERSISVGEPGLEATHGSNLIAAWEPFSAEFTSDPLSFPDARGYAVDVRAPSRVVVPTRATSKQVQADWAGGPRWRGPRPVDPSGGGTDVVLTLNAEATTVQPLITGTLVHELPGELNNMFIIVVRGQTPLSDRRVRPGVIPPAFPPVVADVFTGPASGWPAGTPLPLDRFTIRAGNALATSYDLSRFVERFRPVIPGGFISGPVRPDIAKAPERFAALALYHHLSPPDFEGGRVSNDAGLLYAAYRTSTHGYDLSRWLTQPCIIILGTVGDAGQDVESPIPISVDGEAAPTKGITAYRWVYPLPDRPPRYPDALVPSEDSPAPGAP